LQFASITRCRNTRKTILKLVTRDLILTGQSLYLVGREVPTKGPNKGQSVELVKRMIHIVDINKITLSPFQDDLVCFHILNSYDSCLQVSFKTELVTAVKKLREERNMSCNIVFTDTITFTSQRQLMVKAGGQKRSIKLILDNSMGSNQNREVMTAQFNIMGCDQIDVMVGPGLPNHSRPVGRSGGKKGGGRGGGQRMGVNPPRAGPGAPLPAVPSQPLGPMPANQPKSRPSVRKISTSGNTAKRPVPNLPQPQMREGERELFRKPSQDKSSQPSNNDLQAFLNKPRQEGRAVSIRESIYMTPNQAKPLPAGGRPKPPPRPSIAAKPKARILYNYDRTDQNEIDIREGEVVELISTDPSLNGWYEGLKNDGSKGYFPASYCEKM